MLGGDFNFGVLLLLLLLFVAKKEPGGTRSEALVFALGIVRGPLPILVIDRSRLSVKFVGNIFDRWFR
jgi:hypothetical protein